MDDRDILKTELASALDNDISAAELDEVIARHFPSLEAYRENDDLVLVGSGARRLLVRRAGPLLFRTSENVAASGSTNLLDDALERDLDGLIDEIEAFAAV